VSKFNDQYTDGDLAVGISVPGVTDQISGVVRYVPYFQWRDWDIGNQISKKVGIPVTVENDANAIALAELWFGREEFRKTANFITVMVAEGIGTGIVFDGQVYRGEKGAAGEFGHMIVGSNAPVECSCGSFDCWEAHASENAMLARYHGLVKENMSLSRNIDINQLIGLANRGETEAIAVMRETARYLGIGISNLIVGLSPQAIVVSGRITKAWDCIYDELASIVERSVRQGLPKTKLLPSSLGDQPTLIGSLSLVLARKFASAS
jgi:predicted NBD/HSP70 family sugar kinase